MFKMQLRFPYLTPTFLCDHEVKLPMVRYEELQLYRTSGSKRYSLDKSCLSMKFWAVSFYLSNKNEAFNVCHLISKICWNNHPLKPHFDVNRS